MCKVLNLYEEKSDKLKKSRSQKIKNRITSDIMPEHNQTKDSDFWSVIDLIWRKTIYLNV